MGGLWSSRPGVPVRGGPGHRVEGRGESPVRPDVGVTPVVPTCTALTREAPAAGTAWERPARPTPRFCAFSLQNGAREIPLEPCKASTWSSRCQLSPAVTGSKGDALAPNCMSKRLLCGHHDEHTPSPVSPRPVRCPPPCGEAALTSKVRVTLAKCSSRRCPSFLQTCPADGAQAAGFTAGEDLALPLGGSQVDTHETGHRVTSDKACRGPNS